MINNKYIMGKLGNNLKSTIIVLIAILAALASLPFAANFFGIKSPAKNGANNMEANASEASLNTSYVTKQPSGNTLTYNGSEQSLVNAGTTINSDYWLEYSFSSLSDTGARGTTADLLKGTNADTYTIYVGVYCNESGYVVQKATSSFTATIGKATPVITSTTVNGINCVYNGTDQVLFSGKVTTSSECPPSFGISESSDTEPTEWQIINSGGTVPVTRKFPGTYYLWLKVEEVANYLGAKFCSGIGANENSYAIATISSPTLSRGDVSPVSSDLTYNGGEQDLFTGAASKDSSAGAVYYAVTTNGNEPNSNVEGTTTLPKGIDAGTYTLFYRFSDGLYFTNWTTENELTKTINKAAVSATVNINVIGNTKYCGTQTLFNVTSATFKDINGNVLSGEVAYGISFENQAVVERLTGSAVGTYVACYKFNPTDNNYQPTGWVQTDKSITIQKNDLNPTFNLQAAPTQKYNGEERNMFSGNISFKDENGVTVTGDLTLGMSYNNEITEGLVGEDAGVYTAYYKFTPYDTNYNAFNTWQSTEKTAEITKAIITPEVDIVPVIAGYNGSPQVIFTVRSEKFYGVIDEELNGQAKYGVSKGNSDYIQEGLTGTYYDEYYAWYSFTPTGIDAVNYEPIDWTPTGVKSEITKASPDISYLTEYAFFVNDSIDYDEGTHELYSSSVIGCTGGTIYYYCGTSMPNSSEEGSTNFNSAVTKTNAATYYLYYRIQADDSGNFSSVGWTSAGSKMINSVDPGVKINSVTPVILADSSSIISGTDSEITFTGAPQSLFVGDITFKNPITGNQVAGEVIYGVGTNSRNVLQGLKATYVEDYNLYYQFYPTNKNYNTITVWQATGLVNTINKATPVLAGHVVSVGEKTYTGFPQTLFDGSASFKNEQTGNNVSGIPYYEMIFTKPDGSDGGVISGRSAINAGTYRIRYCFDPIDTNNYKVIGEWIETDIEAVVNKATPIPTKGTLQRKTDLVYQEDNWPQLFENEAESITDGKIYYIAALVGTKPDAGQQGKEDIAQVIGHTAGEYVLWARTTETDNCYAVEWTNLGISAVISDAVAELIPGDLSGISVYFDDSLGERSLFRNPATSSSGGKITYGWSKEQDVEPSSKNDSSVVNETLIALKAKNVGTYYLWYKIEATENYSGITKWTDSGIFAEIKFLEQPKWIEDTDNRLSGVQQELIYSGEQQTLFKGNSFSDGDGKIYYTVTNSPYEKPSEEERGESKLENVKGLYACDKAGNNYTYYLWRRKAATTNSNAIEWELVSNVQKSILKATMIFDFAEIANRNVDYNGNYYYPISDAKLSSSTGNVDDFKITYEIIGYLNNGQEIKFNAHTLEDAKKIGCRDAGLYSITASWEGNAEDQAKMQYSTGQTTPINFIINAITIDEESWQRSALEVIGLVVEQELEIEDNGACMPFAETESLDLRLFGIAEQNGITTAEYNYSFYNELEYALVQGEPSFQDFVSVSDGLLAQNLSRRTINKFGTWHLWFKVKAHCNLTRETIFKAVSFKVLGHSFDYSTQLTGLTMLGVETSEGSRSYLYTYDGKSHHLASGELTPVDANGVSLGAVKYAVSEYQYADPSELSWHSSISHAELSKIDTGVYYFWVQWEGSDTVPAHEGLIYATVQFNKFNPLLVKEKVYFSGVTFGNGWGIKYTESETAVASFTSTFQNKAINIAEPSENINVQIEDSIIADFGNLEFAMGNSQEFAPYNGWGSVDELSVTKTGSYYLWVRWSDNNNIADGSMVYQYKHVNDHKIYTTEFSIEKLKSSDLIALTDTNFITAQTLDFKYELEYNSYSPVDQSLYILHYLPSIKVNNEVYQSNTTSGITFQYLANDGSDVNANTSGWVDSIQMINKSTVGTYTLWVKVSVFDDNIETVTVIRVNAVARINPVESFVATAPTVTPIIYFDGKEHNLIESSSQIYPPVEYRLKSDDDWITPAWTKNPSDIQAIEVGTYYIYYRGGADSNFITQAESSAKYITVIIQNIPLDVKQAPQAIRNLLYTGSEKQMFNQGYDNSNQPLLYRWEDETDFVSYSELSGKVNAGVYTLWFAVNNSSGDVVPAGSIQCKIAKAEIFPDGAIGGLVTYKASDYSVLEYEITYSIYDDYEEPITDWDGRKGTISYAVSRSAEEQPGYSAWTTSYESLKARTVGSYFVWIKVDEGDNHKALEPTCISTDEFYGSPLEIVAAPFEATDETYNFDFENVVTRGSTLTLNSNLYYNGQEIHVLDNLELKFGVARRDNGGWLVDNEGNEVTDAVNVVYDTITSDSYGKCYYALGTDPEKFPKDNSMWYEDWRSLTQVAAGEYYLMVKLVATNDANIGTVGSVYQFCLSDDPIIIEKAGKDQITVDQFTPIANLQFNTLPQTLAEGSLRVAVNGEYYPVNKNWIAYCYLPVNETPNESTEWFALEDLKVINAGKYQVYVKIDGTDSSIDWDTESLIYPLFNEFAEIKPLESSQVEIIAPTFKDLVYNGNQQDLLSDSIQKLKIKNITSEFSQGIGEVKYFISYNIDEKGNECSLANLTGLNAGTYYIWAEIAEGVNHKAIEPRSIGSVTIHQADGEFVTISGIKIKTDLTYNGKDQRLIESSNIVLSNDEYVLGLNDYEKIQYAYSESSNTQPTDWNDDFASVVAEKAGKFYIWVRVVGNAETNFVTFVKCYEEFVNIEALTLYSSNIRGITYNDLTYTGKEQILATVQNTLVIKLSTDSNVDLYDKNLDLEIRWGVSEFEDQEPAKWYNNLDNIKGKEHGDYYLWVKSAGNNNIKLFSFYLATLNIAQAEIVFSKPIIYDAITYNGANRQLLSSPAKTQFDGLDDVEVEIFYSVNGEQKTKDYSLISAKDAGTYTITYTVEASKNWKWAEETIQVEIASADVFDGLNAKIEDYLKTLTYNGAEQNLVSEALAECFVDSEAVIQGSRIVFYYNQDTETVYEFGYHQGRYTWGSNGPLQKKDSGQYIINYYITASSLNNNGNSNYSGSEHVKNLCVTINPCEISWQAKPQAKLDLTYNGQEQPIITAGTLNGLVSEDVTVVYSMIDPSFNDWNSTIPSAKSVGPYHVWYKILISTNENKISNYVFADAQDGLVGMLSVNIAPIQLSVLKYPTARQDLTYNGESQLLVDTYLLSTDDEYWLENNKPYFEFCLLENVNQNNWSDTVFATQAQTYTICYRLIYDQEIFAFAGETNGQFTVKIDKYQFAKGAITAKYNLVEGNLSYELTDATAAALSDEFASLITYYYRKYDCMSGQTGWLPWNNQETKLTDKDLGSYQFMLRISGNQNFTAYTQAAPYDSYEITTTRTLKIEMKDGKHNNLKVRAWVDYTGSTSFEDSVFKTEQEAEGSMEIILSNIDSIGTDASVIRVQIISDSYFYYTSLNLLSPEDKKAIQLNEFVINTEQTLPLGNDTASVYVYELYRISYDANGGNGKVDQSWKWHGIDYVLPENTFTKQNESGEVVNAIGWKAGNGDAYDNKGVYAKDASQVFYAIYPNTDTNLDPDIPSEPEIPETPESPTAPETDDKIASSNNFTIYIIAGSGVGVVVIAVVLFIIIRKKRA